MLILSFLSWLSLFMIISLTSLLGRLLISTMLFFLSEFCPVPSSEIHFLLFSFFISMYLVSTTSYMQMLLLLLLLSHLSHVQLCATPMDGSPPGSHIPRILQARTLEWVAISSSNEWKWKVKVKSLSHVQLLATPWTAAYQAPPPMGVFRQEYWSGVPLPSPYMQMIPL